MSNSRRPGRPLAEPIQTQLRRLIRERGVAAVAADLWIPKTTVAHGAAGGDVHRTTQIAITVGLGQHTLEAPTA